MINYIGFRSSFQKNYYNTETVTTTAMNFVPEHQTRTQTMLP